MNALLWSGKRAKVTNAIRTSRVNGVLMGAPDGGGPGRACILTTDISSSLSITSMEVRDEYPFLPAKNFLKLRVIFWPKRTPKSLSSTLSSRVSRSQKNDNRKAILNIEALSKAGRA